ncbi:MAG: metal-dependent hydrolase [Candidatus Heimdallarchaeaceae archaeon]
MRPTTHFHSSLFLLGIIYLNIPEFSWVLGIIFLAGSVLIDLDRVLSAFLKEKNHRHYVFHSLLFWISLSALFLILRYTTTEFFDYFLVFCLGAIWHLLFDLLDWGLPVLPLQKFRKIYLGLLKEKNLEVKPEYFFLEKYWSSKVMIFVELLFFSLSFLGWFLIPNPLIIGSACIGLVAYLFFIFEMNVLLSIKNK